jgi:heme-degrading monooxygenase HmoA
MESNDRIDPEGRTAVAEAQQSGQVVLMNCFVVPDGRDQAFLELWTETSLYFRAQPGFVSLKLHRAASVDAHYRFVNVAVWESAAHYGAPHRTDEFRRLVTQEAWQEFPSTPTLYEVVVEHSLAPAGC